MLTRLHDTTSAPILACVLVRRGSPCHSTCCAIRLAGVSEMALVDWQRTTTASLEPSAGSAADSVAQPIATAIAGAGYAKLVRLARVRPRGTYPTGLPRLAKTREAVQIAIWETTLQSESLRKCVSRDHFSALAWSWGHLWSRRPRRPPDSRICALIGPGGSYARRPGVRAWRAR
jgi:hypothetical protein